MNKVRMTDELVDAINYICSDEPEEEEIKWQDFIDWNKPRGQFYKPYGEEYNRWRYSRWSTMIRRLMRDRIIEDYKARIKWQNKLLRKDGYTGPELGMGIYK